MNANEMIEVIAAERDGRGVEWQQKDCPPSIWYDKPKLQAFNFKDFRFRVKAARPREWWLRLYEHAGVIFPDASSAECEGVTVVHVREVLPLDLLEDIGEGNAL